jgi:hypothetical protein
MSGCHSIAWSTFKTFAALLQLSLIGHQHIADMLGQPTIGNLARGVH